MKIVRYFLHEEDEMTGMHGFMPLWIPKSANFNVSGSRGMIHDSLEHALSDTGKPWQEVVAFGRLLALRAETGVMHGADQAGLGSELYGLVSDAIGSSGDWSIALPDPGPVIAPDEYGATKKMISRVVDGMAKSSANSCGDRPALTTSACVRAARLLTLGYRDAMRRFGGYSGCSRLAWNAFDWAEQNERKIDDLSLECQNGDVLRLTIDTEYAEVRHAVIRQGERFDWLRHRIRRWRTA